MPRKQQGWITFQSSAAEQQILEQHCQRSQRTKTEILRELLRSLDQQQSTSPESDQHKQVDSQAETELTSPTREEKVMKVSARNILKGTVKQVVTGAVNTEITLEIAPGVEVTSVITKASAEQLGLAAGKAAYAVIKSSNVMMAVD